MDDRVIIAQLIIIIILTGYTLYNIHSFMPKAEKCDISFKVINNCSCIPDQNLADLFNVKDYYNFKINYSELNFSIPLI
jgi:uncharacterized membrane protein